MKIRFGLLFLVAMNSANAVQLDTKDYEAFVQLAGEKYAEGDYNSSRDLCEEVIKRAPAYLDATELLAKTKKQLRRLSSESIFHANLMESFNRLEEAKQYWNRALNYTRAGEAEYDLIQEKLAHYDFH